MIVTSGSNCSICGAQLATEGCPNQWQHAQDHAKTREGDIARAEAFASAYVQPRNFNSGPEKDVWAGVRAGYLQALEDFREHMRKSIKELHEAAGQAAQPAGDPTKEGGSGG